MSIVDKKIGIIGGGQLGKMMILEAKRLGFYVVTLDPTLHCPSHSISDEHIVASFYNEKAIRMLAERVDIITYEFEHIDVAILEELENSGTVIYPSVKSLKVIQNKFLQKEELANKNILIPRFGKISSLEDIYQYGETFGYPLMLKTCTNGYDGKGNYLIKAKEDVENGFHTLFQDNELMVEEFISFDLEISVIAVRGIKGDSVIYPTAYNVHKNSILDTTIVPSNISFVLEEKAKKIAKDVMDVFEGVGTFCIEMFVKNTDTIYINEVAPRPHNSGHYTIEGCRTNQFENHIRAISGLPLGSTSLYSPTVMVNLLGQSNGLAEVLGLEEAYQTPGVNVHIYGKEESKIGRKMGHYTVTASTRSEAIKVADKVRALVKIIGKEEEKEECHENHTHSHCHG